MNTNAVKKALTTGLITGVITGIVCFVIFLFMTKEPMALSAIAFDLPFTVVFAALICGLIQVLMVKKSAKAGKTDAAGTLDEQAAYVLCPKNPVAFLLVFTVLATFLFAAGVVGTLCIFAPNCILPRIRYVAFKSVMSAAAAGYITFHANVFVADSYLK